MIKFIVKNIINLLLIGLILYLVYQKFVINRPEKNINYTELVLLNAKGEQVSMSSLKGQPLFLSFYSSWCAPCMLEMPSIHNLYQELKDENINFLLVNTTSFQDIELLKKKKGYEFPSYLLQSSGSIQIKSIPLTYIIDQNGKVVQVVNRPKNWNSNAVKQKLRNLMNQ